MKADLIPRGIASTGLVGSIEVDELASWCNKWFITLDVDWAHDDVLGFAIDMVEDAGIHATWLITNESRWIDRLSENPLFELGIHPNFDGLLAGETKSLNPVEQAVRQLLEIVPNSRSVRSHALTYSSRLSDSFVELGLTHDLNSYVPRRSVAHLSPWKLPNGQIRVPTIWEDDLEFPIVSEEAWADWETGIRVLNFHPIHLFLNTEDAIRYESTRQVHRKPKQLAHHRNSSVGTRSAFEGLISFLQE